MCVVSRRVCLSRATTDIIITAICAPPSPSPLQIFPADGVVGAAVIAGASDAVADAEVDAFGVDAVEAHVVDTSQPPSHSFLLVVMVMRVLALTILMVAKHGM